MAKEKSIVEDAILQMKNLEEAVAENAKGILASTMKEEISELVKESLNEADEEEEEIDITKMGGIGNTEDSEEEEEDSEEEEEDSEEEEEDSEEEGMPIMPDDGDEEGIEIGDEEPIDLSHESDAEVLRVFQLMGPEDKLIVKKDSAGNINLRDTENDREYMIVGEGSEREETDEMFYETNEQEEYTGGETSEDFYFGDEEGEEEEEENEEEGGYSEEGEEDLNDVINTIFGDEKSETIYELEFSDKDSLEEEDEVSEIDGDDDSVFEIEFNEEDDDDNQFYEQENPNIYESKMTSKAKGVGMGKPKFKYSAKPNMEGGFDKKTGKKADVMMGTGNAKKVKIYKDNTNMDGKMKVVKHGKKTETKEASRTLGNGRNWGRKGLPKPKASPRHIRLESTDAELQILRQKNDEYRKALNVFRNKLNEVAVFNSNLAYATRLFTEHSTSKQEKINILRRFDTVESLKESKNLYKQIKDELGTNKSEQLTESVERVIERAPSTGSSTTLIESKTYENPQFLRMKDLMSKIK